MRRFLTASAVAATLLAGLIATPATAVAREGNSMGHGIKCYWALGADGAYHQVCRKGI